MEYYKEEENKIQADLAHRIKLIALQYDQLPKQLEMDFTVTLHLCLLQNLLTNCMELTNAMARYNGEDLGLKVPLESKTDWTLNEVEIRENSFEGNLTVEVFLIHLRNAMSHPTGTNLDAKFPSTGYNSLPDAFGKIRAIGFCNSPDTINNAPLTWPNAKRQQADHYLDKYNRPSQRNPWNRIPSYVQIMPVGQNQLGMCCFGEQYARVFQAVLTTAQLKSLVLNLANLLAQPALKNWNGKTITNIFAA